jgi:hypothetical protein
MASTLAERFASLLRERTEEARRFKALEDESGIPAVSWRTAMNGGQRPTAEMLEVVAGKWPEHAYWLLTGCTDNRNGHVSPHHESTWDAPFRSRPAATELFRLQRALCEFSTNSTPPNLPRFRQWLVARIDVIQDWLTESQERNAAKSKYFRVHPDLARRKVERRKQADDIGQRQKQLGSELALALRKRDAETKAIYGDQEV